MLTFRKIKKKLKAVSAIETIASAYQEISKKEMNQIRELTLKNRGFIEELTKVYSEAKKAHFFEKKQEKKQKKIKEEETPKKNLKNKAAVFFSVNARFYGGLILKIWQEVSAYLAENEADLVVIGEIGKNLIEKTNIKNKIYYFNLDDEKPKEKEVKKIVDFIKNYKEIKIFHGKFKTVLFQEIAKTDLSGEILKEKKEEIFSYLFEPSKEAVLDFFRTELMTAFFTQAFLEHRLSRHATRMVQMYKAREKSKERKEDLESAEKKLKWRIFDKKQQEINFSSKSWK